MRYRLMSALHTLRDVFGSVEPGAVSGEEALELVTLLGETERAAASGMARLTPRVIETGAFAKAGFSSAQDRLAAVSGTSSSSARSRLSAAEHAARSPELSRPIREGRLSAPEIGVLAQSALEAPEALGDLVDLATGDSSFKELSGCSERGERGRSNEGIGPPPSSSGATIPAHAVAPRRARRCPRRSSSVTRWSGPESPRSWSPRPRRGPRPPEATTGTRSKPTASTSSWSFSGPLGSPRMAGRAGLMRSWLSTRPPCSGDRSITASTARSKASAQSPSRRRPSCSARSWHASSSNWAVTSPL
jgi:hypothetical protein